MIDKTKNTAGAGTTPPVGWCCGSFTELTSGWCSLRFYIFLAITDRNLYGYIV